MPDIDENTSLLFLAVIRNTDPQHGKLEKGMEANGRWALNSGMEAAREGPSGHDSY